MRKRFLSASILAVSLSGCASLSAVEKNRVGPNGIPIFAPKTIVVVNAEGTTPIIVPDCSKEYRVQISSFLAKNHTKLEVQNGMLTSVDSNQDSTALPLALVQLIRETALAGKPIGGAFSSKADGGVSNRFGIFELSCEGGKLSIVKSPITADLIEMPTTRANSNTEVGGIGNTAPSDSAAGVDMPGRQKE